MSRKLTRQGKKKQKMNEGEITPKSRAQNAHALFPPLIFCSCEVKKKNRGRGGKQMYAEDAQREKINVGGRKRHSRNETKKKTVRGE